MCDTRGFVFFHLFCPAISKIEQGKSQLKANGTASFLDMFIYLPLSIFNTFVLLTISSVTFRMSRTSDILQFEIAKIKYVGVKCKSAKTKMIGCSCWQQTGNRKIWEPCVCCFMKHLFLLLFLAALAASCQQGSWFGFLSADMQ